MQPGEVVDDAYVQQQQPQPYLRGRGRRHADPVDHKVTEDFVEREFAGRATDLGRGQGRRGFEVKDTVKEQVIQPGLNPALIQPPPAPAEMKDALLEWLTDVHGLIVFDQRRWEEDVVLKKNGIMWAVEAIGQDSRTYAREGPSAKALAERMSMMTVPELRHFGVRFDAPQELGGSSGVPRRIKHATLDDNMSLASPGMHVAMRTHNGVAAQQIFDPETSFRGNLPEKMQRRYISSGKHNFESIGILAESGGVVKTEEITGKQKSYAQPPDSVSALVGGREWSQVR